MFGALRGDAAAASLIDHAGARLARDLWSMPPDADIFANALAQPLICAFQAAAWAALSAHLPRPRAIAGYSLGELSAYGCAGALPFDALLDLAMRRAAMMDMAQTVPGGLIAARGVAPARIAALCAAHDLHVAIMNGPDRVVVGGPAAGLTGFAQAVAALGGQTTALAVHVAAHTPLLTAAVAPFAAALADQGLRAPTIPVIAGLDAAPVFAAPRAIATLSRQIAEPIRWADCVDTLREMGCTVLLELGPGAALARMVEDRHPDLPTRALADFRSPAAAAAWAIRQLT